MNKPLIAVIAVVIGAISIFAISPYFTESMIDEPLPTGAQPKMEDTMMEDTMEKESPVSYSGTFVGVGDGIHEAQGYAYTIQQEDGRDLLRLENFKSTNGPDLYVYLATDKEASDYVNLGKLKANIGNQNYDIPNDLDLSQYDQVLIWCKTFGVLFGSAEISLQ